MLESQRGSSLVIPLVMLAVLYIVSVVFFHFIEGWDFLDAAYFTTMTISTVGYGDIIPETTFGKVGAILLVFAGVSLAFYVISHLGALREKKVDPEIQKRINVLKTVTAFRASKVKKSELERLKKKIRKRFHKKEK